MNVIFLLSKLPIWLLLGLSSIGATLGDLAAKYWSVHSHRQPFFWLAFVSYIVSGTFFLPTLLKQGLVVTSVIWGIFNTIGFLFIGIVLFHEHFTSLQALGVGVGIVALLLLAFS